MQDDIDRLVEEKKRAANFKMCPTCKQETPFSQRTCRLCKTKLVKYDVHFDGKVSSTIDPYDHFNVKPLENEIEVVVGEPDMLNPSGYQNISEILTLVGERASIDRYCKEEKERQRKWIFLENDGGIMNPTIKLIFNVYRCSRCEEKMYGRENFEKHLCTEAFHLAPVHEFDWIIPQSGLLHFEMITAKSFMGLCWEPFMKEICKELGFVSENAQAYAKKGADHHKLWDIIEICYIAFTDKLLHESVRNLNKQGVPPTVNDYWEYSPKISNPNYLFMQQITFTFLHGLMILRKGIRVNSYKHIYAGKNKLSVLLFGKSHLYYQQLISFEKTFETLIAHEIRALKHSCLVLSRTRRSGHNKSGDAVREEINKEANWDIVGVPNETQWKRSFRNLDIRNT